ncbi:tyrosine-type recombinase/integrase [Kribbella sp. CA-293567]|uniref:tyrosine-type recombinase/integrase n=1 Tax=Kribbella sp. CA-293567 TaxID=3002436 RepID=UPI0022DD1509|nr:tyrosine-type recombinase/integrase [Kribbella sp. CA-293567]WBQ01874.1 tyrosine-type recombinase/integrase [Kribbella sp. CA-293567]
MPADLDALVVLETLREAPERDRAEVDRPKLDWAAADWPGVENPAELQAQIADWLTQYANAGTRKTYGYALGLPAAWVDDLAGGIGRESTAGGPPGGRPGVLHHLAWFRWCASRGMDPRAATGNEVKAWLHQLDAAGAEKRTRQRMLSTLSAFYAHLTEAGVVPANPAALNRARLGLGSTARDASPTIRLTAGQLRALLDAAADLPNRTRYRDLYARRAVAVVGLLTLGLRVSELVGLDRDSLVLSGGEPMLRVLGKGGVHREVYLTNLAATALTEYLAERDRTSEAATPALRGRTSANRSPMIATRVGGRCSRFDINTLLRRVAVQAGPALAEVADKIHPHALRHAYVTIALEQDARIQHVQADVGHATIATTQYYDRGRRTRDTTAADLVAAAIEAVPGHPATSAAQPTAPAPTPAS